MSYYHIASMSSFHVNKSQKITLKLNIKASSVVVSFYPHHFAVYLDSKRLKVWLMEKPSYSNTAPQGYACNQSAVAHRPKELNEFLHFETLVKAFSSLINQFIANKNSSSKN